jgi:hypothetical protein
MIEPIVCQVKQVAWALVVAMLTIIVWTVVVSIVFQGIDWLRNFGTANSLSYVLPRLDNSDAASSYFGSGCWRPLVLAIDWYNSVCIGWLRMGSGVGMMAGAFVSIGPAKSKSLAARVAVGVLAGAVIGGRVMLMLTSSAFLVLICSLIGAVVTVAYLWSFSLPSRWRPLPDIAVIRYNS